MRNTGNKNKREFNKKSRLKRRCQETKRAMTRASLNMMRE
jgi:hypothetical protein